MATAFEECILRNAEQLNTDKISAATAFACLAEEIVAIQAQFFIPSKVPRSAGRQKVHPPASRLLHRRNPSTRFRRLPNGMRVPAHVEKLFNERRELINTALSAKSQLKRDRCSLSDPAYAEASTLVEANLAEAEKLRKKIQRNLDSISKAKYESEATRLSHLLRKHPRKFFRALRLKLPQPAGVYDDSAGPSPEQNDEFREFFAGLLRKLMLQPAGVGLKYRANIPVTDPATMSMLLATVTWQEVYAVLYPSHPKARREPCLPDCKLCPLFADHVDDFDHGNTHMQQPEHKPRLWTSKSAGPDGVYAETLRWTCPKDPKERHEFRKRISAALASIFNRVIVDGRVPECPQFAEATMSALYKGVGDRSAPTNYRGICVPNVLAKLFGLVLGTRLSHWSVVNGVISPAQAGFVVLHGCEYHIFTLMEILRQRVRHNRDTVLVFIDFRKAYDSLSQDVIWEVLELMGIPPNFIDLLKSWTAQSRITLCVEGSLLQPSFPQEMGVPQGGVLSPILFNIVLEILLRFVNTQAAALGVNMAAEDARRKGVIRVPPAIQLLALAYADDVVLICPDVKTAQQALNLVQEWAVDFGMTIGVGQGKTQAMFVSAEKVKLACANDVNGMPKKGTSAAAVDVSEDAAFEDPDDDNLSFVDEDDEPCDEERDDPTVVEQPQTRRAPLRKGQAYVKGELRGTGTGKPLKYGPRPLPPPCELPPLTIAPSAIEHEPTPVPWTNLYKYLGFMIRSDLLDDHAYARVLQKTKAAAERLFPHHRLVRSWPLGQKLQLLQTIVLSVSTNVMPLLTSMRCASESKTKRLDQLWKKIARSVLRLHGSARYAYVVAEASLGDVIGCITQHRVRFQLSLEHHPLANLAAPPIACQVLEIVKAEAACFRLVDHSLLLAPWTFVTDRIAACAVASCNDAGWPAPTQRCEVPPYASIVARLGERERWIAKMMQRIDWACDSFALRPPSNVKGHTAALHWGSRLKNTDVGGIPKLTPLSVRGPHGNGSIVALSRLLSNSTHLISRARQGVGMMHLYPFAKPEVAAVANRRKGLDSEDTGAIRFRGKTCHL